MISIFIGFSLSINAQESQPVKISGNVSDFTNGELLPGVNVSIKGTQTGSVSDINGRYTIDVLKGSTLVFSFVGYETNETVVGSQQQINVRLRPTVESLEEIVVIGYGLTTKKEVTGSITSLKSEDFNKGSYSNPMGLLQGKVAGLSITKPSGADPQAGYQILLRGTNTLTSGQGPLIIVDGIAGVDLRNVSFEEVESIDVLKDGAAAAIYGTRGSNGVIIITTKRAKTGQSKVDYSGYLSVQVAPRMVENLTADQFREAITKYAPEKAGSIYEANTDWFKEITRQMPFSQRHNLAISGGNETFSHRTIFFVDQSAGILKDNEANNYLLKTNINQKALGGLLTVDYNLSYGMRNYKPANYDLFYQAFIRNPTSPVYDPENTYSGGYTLISGMNYYNPVAMQNERRREGKTDDAGANVRASLQITKNLSLVNLVSIEKSDWEELRYNTKYYPSRLGSGGEAEISNGRSSSTKFESTVNYRFERDKHSLQALGGYSFEEVVSNNSYLYNTGFDTDLYGPHNIGTGSALGEGRASMGSYKGKSRLISFFGRVMYNFDDRYLAAASLRREGSSRFGDNNKWGWFPSASFGWRINREAFMEDVSWVDDLKLRVGYGVTGNQEIGNYRSLLLMGRAGKFYYNGQWINTYQPASNPNPDLKWENKSEVNAGIDFAVLNNRLGGAFDLYYRKSTDLLYTYEVSVPPYLFKELFTNIGTISNRGIEVSLRGVPIRTASLNWTSILTFSKNKNILDKFSNEEFTSTSYDIGWIGHAIGVNSQKLREGESLGTFYGPVWLGLDENGRDRFKNANPIGLVNPDDWEVIGNAFPDFTLGWSNMVTYGEWDMSFSLRASIGGEVLNTYRLYYENWGSIGLNNVVLTQLENPDFTGNARYSSKYVEDATFVKLDNISVGYNLPLNHKFISKLRVYASAQDVLTITGYQGLDPEVNLGGLTPGIEYLSYYPRTTLLTFGLNVSF
ncbi:MAG: TonB-dependent receptor [Bacteroidetes bacterium HGW-Bacteroidetes-1]|jgi:TonB-linked SusC/RagA family outer membrane protein|nr:MAG: TonB-dependent receptor [Bacteroidetes bacterium HGW-Bacteroidetes-1]